jgi:branched-chain amino acid transport system permease protein
MRLVVQYAVDAVGIGSIDALMSLSIALLFNVMGLINFAYGELIMVGAYTMYGLRNGPWPLLILGTVAATTVTSLLMERFAFRPVRNADLSTLLVTAFAVSAALQSLALMIFGSVSKGIRGWPSISGAWVVGGVQILKIDVISVVTTVVLLCTLTVVLNQTMLGIQLRASTENFRMARLVGVHADRVIASAFGITGVLAGAVTLIFIARVGVATPTIGFNPLLVAFVGAVIGGLGGLFPAAAGGFALGVITTSLQASLPVDVGPWTQTLTFVCVVAVLLFRPGGLAARRRLGQRVV